MKNYKYIKNNKDITYICNMSNFKKYQRNKNISDFNQNYMSANKKYSNLSYNN